MKRRILAMALASALALSLAACGGGNGGGSASSTPGGSSSVSSSQPDGSAPDGSNPDVSSPDGSQPDASDPDGSASGSAGGSASSAEGLKVTLTLNRTNIELNKAGATFRLRYTAEPDTDGIPTFTSSDTKVATVAEDGTIKAVAPGKATITVTYDGATATASVNCSWKESQPAPAPKPDASKPDSSGSGSSGGSSSSAPAASVNLSDFYTTTTGKYQFSFMMEADETMLATFFTGLDGQPLSQQVLYLCGMSPSPHGDFALVQVSDPKNVDTVKAIFQARIDYMVGDGNGPGGAWYPGPTEQWQNNSRVVSNGNYVMMVVHENCDDIVAAFNALF